MSEQMIGGKAYRLYSQGLSAYDEVTAIPRNKYNFTGVPINIFFREK